MSDGVERRITVDVGGELWSLVNDYLNICEWRLFRGDDTVGPSSKVVFFIGEGLHTRDGQVPRGVLAAFRQPVRDWYRRVLVVATEQRDRMDAFLCRAEEARTAARREYERALGWHHALASIVKDISCEVDS